MALVRLDKLLSDMGIASRKELKDMIRRGRVSVNGVTATAPDMKLDGETALVCLDGQRLSYSKFHYFMIDKPTGVLSVTEDRKQATVMDLITPEMRRMGLFPVGRLDKDTSGLLILTNDGDYAHRVISPKSGVEKLYYARVEGTLSQEDVDAFEKGIILADGTECLPAKLEILGEGECLVRVMEGKYHQVRRMLASRGAPVSQLRRLAVGALKLDETLGPGGFRELDQTEKDQVYNAT